MKAATRSAVGLLLLLAYAAVSDARWIYRAGQGVLDAGEVDSITSYERRYRELKQALPRAGSDRLRQRWPSSSGRRTSGGFC